MFNESAIGSIDCIFFKEINRNGSFHAQEEVRKTFFTDRCTWNFFLSDNQWTLTCWTSFSIQVCKGKPIFSQFVKTFTTKNFSVDIKHSYVNFIRLARLNNLKFDDRPLFKPRILDLICDYLN